jgi:hypothetical protein
MTSAKREVRKFSNGQSLVYDSGVFDVWCTYICNPDGSRDPPHDIEYFSTLESLGKVYGTQKLYSDLKKIFVLTDREINEKVLEYISLVSEEYLTDRSRVEILFTVLYAAFVAEENKARTKLGKRIKFLGIHQILIDGVTPEIAANFSKGMPWQDISKLCEKKGF